MVDDTITTGPSALKALLREGWNTCGEFRPTPHYCPDGDHLTIFFSDALCSSERIDDLLTVYLADHTRELVGCKIKGVAHIITYARRLMTQIDVHSETVDFSLILMVAGASATGPKQEIVYEIADKVGALPLNLAALGIAANGVGSTARQLAP